MKRLVNVMMAVLVTLVMICGVAGCGAAGDNSDDTGAAGQEAAEPVAEETAEGTAGNAESKYPIIDSHLHYLDFLQESDGFDSLVEAMDKANVPYAVLLGMPMAKEWDEDAPQAPSYYLSDDASCYFYSATDYILMEEYLAQPEEVQKRFFPFICGANTNDIYAAKHLRRVLETYPGKIYGIGEVMSRHDDLTALTYGENPEANNPAFMEIYDLAAEYDIPVLVHHNIGPSTVDDPIYMEEMEEALAHNRKTNIIWAHTGISRRVMDSEHVKNIENMLKKNKNLYVDISWVVWEDYIDENKATLKDWAELIEKYPDRFLVGSDKVAHWDGYEDEVTKYYPLLDMLSDETVKKITQTNVLTLIHVDPDTLLN